ncbi:hypothetical protein ASZ90_005544 [hydrocarbon metagenome]|uniref:Uncharacterized protein n=1 Tax=hydrocarbon metagenome TaxID=938273 RepID=A0A0W8FVB6_9ZZZZ
MLDNYIKKIKYSMKIFMKYYPWTESFFYVSELNIPRSK